MTLSCDAPTEGLWAPRAPVISECWSLYSPSSCLSSQPCSPGPAGGLAGHAEKNYVEMMTLPCVFDDSFNRSKRIRLHSETSAFASVQAYKLIESAQVASAQLANSVTPSSHNCGNESFLQLSGDLSKFGSQLSSNHVGGSLASSVNRDVQHIVAGSAPELSNNLLIGITSSEGLLGSASSFVGKPSSVPLWQSQPQLQLQQESKAQLQFHASQLRSIQPLYQPLQALYQPLHSQQQPLQQQLQQQLAQLVSEQPALVCSNTNGSLALSLAVCEPQPTVSCQMPAPGMQHRNVSLQAAEAAGLIAGCGAMIGNFSLPFIFTGTSTVVPPVAPAAALAPAVPSLPVALPTYNVSTAFVNTGLVMPSLSARLSTGHIGPLPAAFSGFSKAVHGGAVHSDCTAVLVTQGSSVLAPQLQQQQSHTLLPHQPQTPRFGAYLPEQARCGAAPGDSDPQVFPKPQLPQQKQLPAVQQKAVRQTHPRRTRPLSSPPPTMPSTPVQLGTLGSEDWILHAVKILGMSEPDTARLALHCWRRISELPQLHHAVRLWPTSMAGRNLYATACLWISIKLEEKRRSAPGGVVLAHMAIATPSALCSAELAVMNWLGWRPYDGYRLDESHLLVYM